ncbi:hypothetical protein IMZ31_19680 (plasmid) [Pontibacillus sp. ALD_SL1]|uniref:hypothetical protein n=1 Tax=Pontibacillus sp. ALD_SL1 TaxID=2777185 RepID=UPI001A9636D3|nr:hypothetical protein [Pontibacillus sp. ALD_SL1]QST02773.1 hypothetical protein IMZ31_19680 [Pontibacillus sp. ALD_SL1]
MIGCLFIVILWTVFGIFGWLLDISPILAGAFLISLILWFAWYVHSPSYKEGVKRADEEKRLKRRYRKRDSRRGRTDMTGELQKDQDLHNLMKQEEEQIGRKLTEDERRHVEERFTNFLKGHGIRYEGYYTRVERMRREDRRKEREFNDIFKS